MRCNCRVSCGACIPQDYFYGTCDDYHRDCQSWANRGECGKNPWMLENCKFSCGTCLTNFELRQLCRSGGSPPRGRGRGGRWGRGNGWEFEEEFGRFGRDVSVLAQTSGRPGHPAPIGPPTM
ncbi:TYR-4 protein [Aphelenchoides avenae]|nr:TYR-4 protein [Aphelenchus avenae]